METKATSCNPTLYIDLLETTNEVDEVLHNNYIPTNLHLDTRNISWNKVSQDMDLLHMPKQAHLTEKFAEVYEILEVQAS
jgi:hypothetical protein